jgi:tetratricopeptide (TPR) repeat protein
MIALLLTVALSISPSAHAEAERLAKQSITDYNVGDFDSALKEATAAYKLDPRPGLLYNLGQVHRALHHWEQAEFYYRGYLRGQPNASNRAAVEQLIAEMQAKQAAPPSQPPGQPFVATYTPTPRPAPATVAPTQVPVVIANQPAPAPASQPLATPPPPNEQQSRTIIAAEPGANNQAEGVAPVTKSHTAAFILGAVAIAAAGVAATGYYWDIDYTNWSNATFPNNGTVPVAGSKPPPINATVAKNWTITANVLVGVSAAALIGAIVVW